MLLFTYFRSYIIKPVKQDSNTWSCWENMAWCWPLCICQFRADKSSAFRLPKCAQELPALTVLRRKNIEPTDYKFAN